MARLAGLVSLRCRNDEYAAKRADDQRREIGRKRVERQPVEWTDIARDRVVDGGHPEERYDERGRRGGKLMLGTLPRFTRSASTTPNTNSQSRYAGFM